MVGGNTALLERCKSLRSELVRFEPALFSGEDCRALAEELARTEKACAAARARAAARVAECGSFREGGFEDPADWLSRKSGSSRGAANAAIKTAEAARDYRRGHAEKGETCHVMGGGPVPASAARAAAEDDAFIKAVIHDGKKIDTVVHYGRHISAELRTALDLGDPPGFEGVVCVEPGCGRRYGLEWDHVDPVANGGPTSFKNLKPRCWRCHRQKTQRDRLAGLFGNGRAGPFDDEAEPEWDSWDESEDDGWADDAGLGPELSLQPDTVGGNNGYQ